MYRTAIHYRHSDDQTTNVAKNKREHSCAIVRYWVLSPLALHTDMTPQLAVILNACTSTILTLSRNYETLSVYSDVEIFCLYYNSIVTSFLTIIYKCVQHNNISKYIT